ncbi:hypothetical protein [Rheinheimera sp.]|uniref:hypothetical protein n=1 Tax=Rheinheimera sp. TaxID=1869214 RepID=UPI0040471823
MKKRKKALRNQPTVRKEIAESKILTMKRNYNLMLTFVELFIVVFLISTGSSAIVLGLQSIYFPCEGSLCGEIATAGGITLTIGLILLFIASQIILWISVLKD